VLGLAFLVRRRQPGFGLVAGALAMAGVLGLAAVITIDGFAWGIAGELSAKPDVGAGAAAAMLKDLQESEWSYVYYITPLGFIVGIVMLALMVGTETAIVSNVYFIAGAAVFLAGGIAVALAILRMSDEQFAQGRA